MDVFSVRSDPRLYDEKPTNTLVMSLKGLDAKTN
jgi:hypothetical protein